MQKPRLRHWKQQYHKDAAFVWRKSLLYAGVYTTPGEKIPDELFRNKRRLRSFWESKAIELENFRTPKDVLRPANGDGIEDALVDHPDIPPRQDTPDGVITLEGQEAIVTPEGQEAIVTPEGQEAIVTPTEEDAPKRGRKKKDSD